MDSGVKEGDLATEAPPLIFPAVETTVADDFESDIPQIVLMPGVQSQMDLDPEMAEAVRDFSAALRQAMEGVAAGRYDSFEDAMEAITGCRPVRMDRNSDDEDGDYFEID